MPEGHSIKTIIQNNRRFLVALALLMLFTCGLFFNYLYNTQLRTIENLFNFHYQLLQRYISRCLEKALIISEMTPEDVPAVFNINQDIHSIQILDGQGKIVEAYPQENLNNISLGNLDIYQEAVEKNETQIEIMPYSISGEDAALLIAYPVEGRVYLTTFQFNSLFANLSTREKVHLRGDNKGNIILSNTPGGLYTSSHIDLDEGSSFSLVDSVYIISDEIPGISGKVFFIYHIDQLLLKALLLGLLTLGTILLMSWIMLYVTRNFGLVISDMRLLERKSQELVETVQIDSESILRDNKAARAIDRAGEKLRAEVPRSIEMQYAFKSYQELVSELLELIETTSRQNQEIAMMNKAISASYEEINDYQQKILSIIELLSKVDPSTSLEEFLDTILAHAISLIPAADAGSAGIKEGDNFKFLAQSGYSDRLKEVELPVDMLLSSEEPVVFENMLSEYDRWKPEKFQNIFREVAPGEIYSTLVVGLKTQKIIGNIFIDNFSRKYGFSDEDKQILEAIAKVTSLFIYLKLSLKELDSTYIGIIHALAQAVELKDVYTKGHSDRIARYSLLLADELGFSQKRKRLLKEAALLHDVGKIGVSDLILNKPGPLNPGEHEQIQMHTVFGGKILRNVANLQEVADIVLYHHEYWDGSGYPGGLKGEEIPLESRIIALFDAFDTILTARSYKEPLSYEFAIEEVRANAGTQFDPQLAELFLHVVSKEWLMTG